MAQGVVHPFQIVAVGHNKAGGEVVSADVVPHPGLQIVPVIQPRELVPEGEFLQLPLLGHLLGDVVDDPDDADDRPVEPHRILFDLQIDRAGGEGDPADPMAALAGSQNVQVLLIMLPAQGGVRLDL